MILKIQKILLELLVIAIIGTFVFFATLFFLLQPLIVTGNSMLPTFHDTEQILVEKVSIKYRKPERGDIVIVKHPQNTDVLVIKRIIALPGDVFKIHEGKVFLNNQPISEPYLLKESLTQGKIALLDDTEVVVPSNSYIVLGDNREDSIDSRNWGVIDEKLIVGRSLIVYAPLKSLRFTQ